MKDGDLLMITADHGCDPTTPSTDHSREYIPLVVTENHVKANVDLGTRKSFADIGATVYEYLTGAKWNVGTSPSRGNLRGVAHERSNRCAVEKLSPLCGERCKAA
jgi:phosphopentomutase